MSEPPHGARVHASPALVTGSTTPGRAVLVLNEGKDIFEATVDDSGGWWAAVALFAGYNDLITLSVDPPDVSAPILDEDLTIVYVPAA